MKHFRPFVHYHDQAQKSLLCACDSTVCAQKFQKFFLNIAFICNISLFCISPYVRLLQDKLGRYKNICRSTYLVHKIMV